MNLLDCFPDFLVYLLRFVEAQDLLYVNKKTNCKAQQTWVSREQFDLRKLNLLPLNRWKFVRVARSIPTPLLPQLPDLRYLDRHDTQGDVSVCTKLHTLLYAFNGSFSMKSTTLPPCLVRLNTAKAIDVVLPPQLKSLTLYITPDDDVLKLPHTLTSLTVRNINKIELLS